MKIKVMTFLGAGCLLVAAAWLVRMPETVQADDIAEKYRVTVEKGREYLAKKQFEDGHWEGDAGAHPVAMSGLAGLALLMRRIEPRLPLDQQPEREKEREAKHWSGIRKAADWLIAKSQASRNGLFFSDHPSETTRYMQGHGLATLFLAGLSMEETDDARRKKLAEVLARAVKYIVNAQSTQGGWYDTSKIEGHDFASIQATVIQIQALQAATNAGIVVPSEAIEDGQQYLRSSLMKQAEDVDPKRQSSRLVDTAAALATGGGTHRHRLFEESVDVLHPKWFEYCRSTIPKGRDLKFGEGELAHYYFAQAEYVHGGDPWNAYRTAMFDHLQNTQNKDGTWPAGNGTCVGPVYAAAVWCTILQLDSNRHPSMRRDFPTIR